MSWQHSGICKTSIDHETIAMTLEEDTEWHLFSTILWIKRKKLFSNVEKLWEKCFEIPQRNGSIWIGSLAPFFYCFDIFIWIVFVSVFRLLFIHPNPDKGFLIWISSHQDRMNQVLWKRVDVMTSILK
jgi:hypothetical protein